MQSNRGLPSFPELSGIIAMPRVHPGRICISIHCLFSSEYVQLWFSNQLSGALALEQDTYPVCAEMPPAKVDQSVLGSPP